MARNKNIKPPAAVPKPMAAQAQDGAQKPPAGVTTSAAARSQEPPAGPICRKLDRAALDALHLPANTLRELGTWKVRGGAAYDKMKMAPWLTMQPLRVANVDANGHDDKPEGGWDRLWEQVTQVRMTTCAVNKCACTKDLRASHVWVEGLQVGKIAGVVPLCPSHRSAEAFPYPAAMGVRAQTHVALVNAHMMFEGAAAPGANCLPPRARAKEAAAQVPRPPSSRGNVNAPVQEPHMATLTKASAQTPPLGVTTRGAARGQEPPAGPICRRLDRAAVDALHLPPNTLRELGTWTVRGGAGDEMKTAPWLAMKPLRVANVDATGYDDRPEGGWTRLWEKVTQVNMTTCAVDNCTCTQGLRASHVWVEGLQVGKIAGVVPLCPSHRSAEAFPYPMAMGVCAPTHVALVNAHMMLGGAAKPGANCLPPRVPSKDDAAKHNAPTPAKIDAEALQPPEPATFGGKAQTTPPVAEGASTKKPPAATQGAAAQNPPVTRAAARAQEPPAGPICRKLDRAALDALQLPPNTLHELGTWQVRGSGANEIKTAPWLAVQPLRVANMATNGCDEQPEGGWNRLWEKVTQVRMTTCAVDRCTCTQGLRVSHVWVEGLQVGKIAGVVPLCPAHSSREAFPYPMAMGVRAQTHVALVNAHAEFEGAAAKPGANCLPARRG